MGRLLWSSIGELTVDTPSTSLMNHERHEVVLDEIWDHHGLG